MRVAGEKVVGPAMKVGEIAATAAGDQDLLANAIGTLENDDTAAALPCLNSTHQPGGARSEDEDVALEDGAQLDLGWCPETESNRQVRQGTRDFKFYRNTTQPSYLLVLTSRWGFSR